MLPPKNEPLLNKEPQKYMWGAISPGGAPGKRIFKGKVLAPFWGKRILNPFGKGEKKRENPRES